MDFLIILVVLIAIILVAVLLRQQIMDVLAGIMTHRVIAGGAESYFHGSDKIIELLEPRPSGVIDYEKAVFATDSYTNAVIFSAAAWTDYDFTMGSNSTGKNYLVEMYPGAFDKLDAVGYIHHLPSKPFHHDPRLGLDNEFISFQSVKPTKVDKINVKEYLKTSDVRMTTFKEFARDLRVNPRESIISRDNLKKIKTVYVPLDFYWKPSVPGAIFIDRLSPEEINDKIRSAKGQVELVGDIVAPAADCLYDFGAAEIVVLIPSTSQYGSDKTTKAEYDRFLAARKRVLKGVGTFREAK